MNTKGEREVFFELNGQMRSLFVQDREASKDIVVRPKALSGVRGSIGAPMPGEILELKVKEGDKGGLFLLKFKLINLSYTKINPICIVSNENGNEY